MKIVKFACFTLSILFLCGCGGRRPVPQSESEVVEAEPAPAPKVIEKVEEGFSFTSTEEGVVVLKVRGESAERNEEGTIGLKFPEVGWYRGGAPVFLKAQEGTFDKAAESMRARGDVCINSDEWGELSAQIVEWSMRDRVLVASGEAIGKFYIADR